MGRERHGSSFGGDEANSNRYKQLRLCHFFYVGQLWSFYTAADSSQPTLAGL